MSRVEIDLYPPIRAQRDALNRPLPQTDGWQPEKPVCGETAHSITAGALALFIVGSFYVAWATGALN